jgi:Ca2+-dependent lipid-binding protein
VLWPASASQVIRATGLKDADMYDGSDPYCVVYWNDHEIGRSEVFEDSSNPEFDVKFPVRVPLGDTAADNRVNVLRIELFDYGGGP